MLNFPRCSRVTDQEQRDLLPRGPRAMSVYTTRNKEITLPRVVSPPHRSDSRMGGGRCANPTGANRHFKWNFLGMLMCFRPGKRRLYFLVWPIPYTDQTVNNEKGHSMIQTVPLIRCAIKFAKNAGSRGEMGMKKKNMRKDIETKMR